MPELLRPSRSKWYVPARYVLAFMALLGLANVYALRVNLSVAMVEMKKEFPWDSQTRGIILSSFFYGYIFTQIPGGMLAARYGGKWVFGLGCLSTTILTLLTPLAAYKSKWLLVAVRVLEGFGEGVTIPAMHEIWSKWAPPLERSKLVTIAFTGSSAGTVLAMAISGFLCDHGFESPPGWSKWPSVFYVSGAVGLVWCVAWFLLIHSSPKSHPRISPEEREYIESAIEQENTQRSPSQNAAIPFGPIMRSPAVWAILIGFFCVNWGYYTLLTDMPSFLKDVLRFEITKDGFLSAVPFAVSMLTIPVSGWIADTLRERQLLSTTNTRKLMNSFGLISPAVFLTTAGYSTNKTMAVVCLCLAVGLGSTVYAGCVVNHLDIAPRYAGFLMGITNTVGTLPGILGPYVAGAMTPSSPGTHNLQLEWRNVFYLAAEIYTFGAVMLLILTSGEIQWWAS